MKVIVVGRGTIGSAVQMSLKALKHEVITVSRSGGDFRADILDVNSLKTLFADLAPFDAVVSAVGEVVFAPLEQSTGEQWSQAFASKAMGQINLVRTALPYIADRGAFVLISGILSDEFLSTGVIASTVSNAVDGFVKAAAASMPRGIRINGISPAVLTESTAYHPFFPGFPTVSAEEVAQAYVRALSTPINGRILKLHKLEG